MKGRTIVQGLCEGTVLAAKKPLSFLGGVDPNTGTIIEKNHDLEVRSAQLEECLKKECR